MKVITEKTNNLCTPNDFYEAWYAKHKIWKGYSCLARY
jgi:hypothetical protein